MITNLGWEEILVLMAGFAALCWRIARSRGRRPAAGWALLGFWFGPIALLLLLLIPPAPSNVTLPRT